MLAHLVFEKVQLQQLANQTANLSYFIIHFCRYRSKGGVTSIDTRFDLSIFVKMHDFLL